MPTFRRIKLYKSVSRKPKRYRIKWGWKRIPSWRDQIRTAMDWCLAREPQIHYRQSRPFDPNKVLRREAPITTDCSGSTTMLYRAAGRPDPNGNGYDGTGYTGTLRAHTPRTTLGKLKRGDFIVYGPGSGSHVVVVYDEHPTDPLVFSHGQESGPRLYRHSVEDAAHAGSFTCHDGGAL